MAVVGVGAETLENLSCSTSNFEGAEKFDRKVLLVRKQPLSRTKA
jgi:hypothetical protein